MLRTYKLILSPYKIMHTNETLYGILKSICIQFLIIENKYIYSKYLFYEFDGKKITLNEIQIFY